MTTLLTKPQKESRLYVTKPPEESKNLFIIDPNASYAGKDS